MQNTYTFKDLQGVVDFGDNYQVNELGQVRNKLTKQILKPYIRKVYYSVSLSKNSKKKIYDIHRLVALSFVNGYDDGKVVNHIDCNPHNNHYENLEWVTQKENVNHAIANGLWDTERTYHTIDGVITKTLELSKE